MYIGGIQMLCGDDDDDSYFWVLQLRIYLRHAQVVALQDHVYAKLQKTRQQRTT